MISNSCFLCLLGILTRFVVDSAARVAIIHGEYADDNQFPYQVSVQLQNFIHHCGGGIIGDQLVLTAAHCVVDDDGLIRNKSMFVVAGTNDLRKTHFPAVVVSVKKVYVPKDYKHPATKSFGDIAVLRLKHSLGLSPRNHHVKALKLPRVSHETYPGKVAQIAGFGLNVFEIKNGELKEAKSDRVLHWAKADIINRRGKYYYELTVPQKQITARLHQDENLPRGVCFGDSGSPLVYNGTVIGILSTTPKDCLEETLGAIYTRVSYYLEFIKCAIHDKTHDDVVELEIPTL